MSNKKKLQVQRKWSLLSKDELISRGVRILGAIKRGEFMRDNETGHTVRVEADSTCFSSPLVKFDAKITIYDLDDNIVGRTPLSEFYWRFVPLTPLEQLAAEGIEEYDAC